MKVSGTGIHWRATGAACLLVMSGAGCGSALLSATPSSSPPLGITKATVVPAAAPTTEDGAPMAAFVYLVAVPAIAPNHLRLDVLHDQGFTVRSFDFGAGEMIALQQDFMPGNYRLALHGDQCLGGPFTAASGFEVDLVVLWDPAGRCEVRKGGQHPASEGDHAFRSIAGRVAVASSPGDLTVEVGSLDAPSMPVPEPATPDEAGIFFLSPMAPGRYEVRVLKGGALIASRKVDIPPGEDRIVEVNFDLR